MSTNDGIVLGPNLGHSDSRIRITLKDFTSIGSSEEEKVSAWASGVPDRQTQ